MPDVPYISVITPAFHARKTITHTVYSVLAQTYPHWEMLIISDDGNNYEPILLSQDIHDSRIRFLSSGGTATGESHARNTGLAAAKGSIIALLDADDTFMPEKLERCVPMLERAPVVSCALELVTAEGKHLRNVGDRISTGLVNAETYKTHNFSSETMLLFRRSMIDCRYDGTLRTLADHDFALRCFEKTPVFYHIAEPLQRYYKHPGSVSNNTAAHRLFDASKQKILQRLAEGYYAFADASANRALQRFYAISQHAEREYEARLQIDPETLFEDIIEPMLMEKS